MMAQHLQVKHECWNKISKARLSVYKMGIIDTPQEIATNQWKQKVVTEFPHKQIQNTKLINYFSWKTTRGITLFN